MNLLSSLRYLLALHEHQHFGRAARACNITQPALSNTLRALEREFNVVIVKRDRQYVGLTPEGERVLVAAQRMVHEHTVLEQELRSGLDSPCGNLRIGVVPTAEPIAARFAAMLQARHPGVVPSVLAMSSDALEQGLRGLAIELALGYPERVAGSDSRLRVWPQYDEHYFLLRRVDSPHPKGLQMGPPMCWRDAARLPLCLFTPDMHNRSIVDGAFGVGGVSVRPAMETNSVLAMSLSVVAGDVCCVIPGALMDSVRRYGELEALPLTQPEVRTPVGFMANAVARPSRALDAALVLAQEKAWLHHAEVHSGLLEQ